MPPFFYLRAGSVLSRVSGQAAGGAAQMAPKLGLDPEVVATARRLATRAAGPVEELARTNTTTSVERHACRTS